jgi:PAS domain S-box-containing protein
MNSLPNDTNPAGLPALSALFAGSCDLFAVTDREGRLLYCNHPAAGQTRGVQWSQMLFDLILPDARDTVRQLHQRVAETGQTARCEVPGRGHNGGDGWMLLTSSPISTDGKVTGLMHIGIDITERRREEDRLRRVESLMVDTEGIAHYGIWEWDITQPHASWTPGLYAIYGLDPRTYVPSYEEYLKRVHPDDRQRVIDATNGVFHQHRPYSHDERITHADGSLRYLHTWAVPILGDDGKLLRLMGVCLDITDRKLAEIALEKQAAELLDLNRELESRVQERTRELLSAKDAAEAANEAKSLFLATMSHEIRTPMNGVIGMLELLQLSNLGQDQAQLLGVVRDSAFSLLRILDDVLDFSKIEAGRLTLEEIPLKLEDVAQGVVNTLKPVASARQVTLECSVAAGLPVVMGDPVRLRQVLFNLCSNAVKFTETRAGHLGRVTLAITAGEASAESVNITLQVQDNGIGMASETVARLFQPFVQGEGSTTRRFGGTGLGLSICRRLVALMGGTISVDSTTGQGSTFVVQLRLAQPSAQAVARLSQIGERSETAPARRPAPEIAAAEAAGRLILVAEDNPVNQQVILRQLNWLGYACLLANNGQEALALWQQRRIGLLLTDCHMPEMDGYTLTRQLREQERSTEARRLPVIALTASALSEESRRCFAAGMDDFLAKPIEMAILQRVLEHWLPA